MTRKLKEFRVLRLGQIKTAVMMLDSEPKILNIYDGKTYYGVSTYGVMSWLSVTDVGEKDTIVSVWFSKKGIVYVRTMDNEVYLLENLPTDEIDEIYEQILAIKSDISGRKSCDKWYANFAEENES